MRSVRTGLPGVNELRVAVEICMHQFCCLFVPRYFLGGVSILTSSKMNTPGVRISERPQQWQVLTNIGMYECPTTPTQNFERALKYEISKILMRSGFVATYNSRRRC